MEFKLRLKNNLYLLCILLQLFIEFTVVTSITVSNKIVVTNYQQLFSQPIKSTGNNLLFSENSLQQDYSCFQEREEICQTGQI